GVPRGSEKADAEGGAAHRRLHVPDLEGHPPFDPPRAHLRPAGHVAVLGLRPEPERPRQRLWQAARGSSPYLQDPARGPAPPPVPGERELPVPQRPRLAPP